MQGNWHLIHGAVQANQPRHTSHWREGERERERERERGRGRVCSCEGRMIETLRGVCALLWIVSLGECKIPEFQVTCVFSKDCVLPCTFTPAHNVVIRWYRQDVLLHFFLSSEGQWDESSRMSFFKDQVTHGNASLLLQHSSPADRGRYKCQVNSTGDEDGSIVIVKVEAPITDVSIRLTPDKHIQCQTKGVYPAPSLHWATDPPSPPSLLHSSMRMTSDPHGLHDVESTLTRRPAQITYICNIKAKYSTQLWRATLMEQDTMGQSGRSLLVPCVAPKPLQIFTLSWSFSRGHDTSVLLTYDSRTRRTSGPWKGRVELDQEQVLLGNGSLHLLSPESGENTGSYTCTFSALQTRHVVQTWVNITGPQTAPSTGHKESDLWIIAVVVALLALLITAVLICKRRRARSEQKNRVTEDTEMQPMQTVKPVSESTVEASRLTADQKDTHT
ncbi:uncharacterized protein hhla2a.1 isoform X2 [Clupea harengus]|uniref:Uncharacterized protein hhla2a.1 isoform X2 n=1 Tax=Clupea harengus TaxID=7950 RepID=A0A8M1KPH6_CLUHA|nr:uncharacterized protein hhla2a.1 isoform X2 [Clupea harengus]